MNQSSNNTRLRVYRGGGWYYADAAWFRACARYWHVPSYRNFNLGFRCALRVGEPVGVKP